MAKSILNHKIYGNGRPIYIFHGLFGMLDNWHSFSRQLSEDFQIISADLRNHGRSFHSEDHSYSAMADDVVALMEQLGHESAVFLGHSMGGKVVAQLALDHPERVEGAIIVDILPIAYDRGHDQVLKALNALDIDSTDRRGELKEKLNDLLKGDASTANFLLKSLSRKDGTGFEWRFNLKTLSEDYDAIREGLEADEPYTGATLFIKGSLSHYIGMDGWLETTELFPHADLEEIDEAGHWIHADQPTALLKVVREFMKKVD